MPTFDMRAAIGLLIVFGFMAAYFRQDSPDQMMKGALITAFATATGYWLGSSKGSSEKNAALSQLASATQPADDAAPATPPPTAPATRKK